jgi:hypothetical protein
VWLWRASPHSVLSLVQLSLSISLARLSESPVWKLGKPHPTRTLVPSCLAQTIIAWHIVRKQRLQRNTLDAVGRHMLVSFRIALLKWRTRKHRNYKDSDLNPISATPAFLNSKSVYVKTAWVIWYILANGQTCRILSFQVIGRGL